MIKHDQRYFWTCGCAAGLAQLLGVRFHTLCELTCQRHRGKNAYNLALFPKILGRVAILGIHAPVLMKPFWRPAGSEDTIYRQGPSSGGRRSADL